MIIATPDGKHYMEVWCEEDNFQRRRIIQISRKQATEYCQHHDYIVYRRLSIMENVSNLKETLYNFFKTVIQGGT